MRLLHVDASCLCRSRHAGSSRRQAVYVVMTLSLAAPAPFAQLSAPAASSNSVTLTWTAPGDDGNTGTASQYDLRYSTTPITDLNWSSATQVAGEPSPQPSGADETFTVEDLQPNTTYYFALKAADEASNWSPMSNVANATTDPEQDEPAAVADLSVTNTTSTTATLSWTAPGDDSTVGTASEYDIRYSTSPITNGNWNSAIQVSNEPSPQPAGSNEIFTITDLDPLTTYYFALKTADEIPNWSPLSNVPSGTTDPEDVPPADIVDLQAVSSTESSITLTWTAPGDDGNAGTASQYEMRYSTAPISEVNWSSATLVSGVPSPQPAGSVEGFTVDSLETSTTYYFAIKTADEVPNWSGLSNVVNTATTGDQTPPAAISDLQATAGGS